RSHNPRSHHQTSRDISSPLHRSVDRSPAALRSTHPPSSPARSHATDSRVRIASRSPDRPTRSLPSPSSSPSPSPSSCSRASSGLRPNLGPLVRHSDVTGHPAQHLRRVASGTSPAPPPRRRAAFLAALQQGDSHDERKEDVQSAQPHREEGRRHLLDAP